MKRSAWTTLGLSTLLLLVACASGEETASSDSYDTADPRSEDLKILPGTYSARLSDNIGPDDVKKSFGVDENNIPYPDTYWPFNAGEFGVDGIDFRWKEASTESPLEKFASVVSGGDADAIARTKLWEHDHHGIGLGVRQHREVADWEGHCPGWTGASLSNAPVKHAVFAKPAGNGDVTECSEADAKAKRDNCTRFEIGDINALMAEVYVDGVQPLVGSGCFTKEPTVDEFDRIKRNPDRLRGENGAGCRGRKPGSLLMLLGNRMKREHQGFAINAQREGITDQIWNQPVYRYTVNQYEEIDEARAIALVAENSQGTAAPSKYIWNAGAKGFALVDISMSWVREMGPNRNFVSGEQSTMAHRVKAVIELDRTVTGDAGARAQAKIIGGEYLTDAAAEASNPENTVGPNRLAVPSFVWISVDAGPENLTVEESSNPRLQHHNPFIKPSVVKKLIALGQK